MDDRFAAVQEMLREAVEAHVFPCAVVEVGTSADVLLSVAAGARTFDPLADLATPATIFDLASLTKVMSTATLVMRAVDENHLRLDDPVSAWLSEWRGMDREGATIRDLLAHSSGLAAYLPFFRDHTARREFQHAICTMPLEYAPGTQSIYSDLGFICAGVTM